MATKTKSPSRTSRFKIGRRGFAKISAIEGIHASRELEADFHEFNRQGLSAAERRLLLARKYSRKS